MSNKLRVLFFLPSLGGGGAEMHLLRVANQLDRQRFTAAFAVAGGGGSYEGRLRPEIALRPLSTARADSGSSTARIIRAIPPLRHLIKEWQPDLVCSLLDHANLAAILATRSLSRPPALIIGLQNTLSASHWRSRRPQSLIVRALAPRLYPLASQVLALSHGVAADAAACIPALRGRIAVIYNAGLDQALLEQAREPLPERAALGDAPLILACGRLTPQKGFHHLIDALAIVRRDLPAQLWIIGRGELRNQLERRAAALGLAPYVRFLGFQQNPFRYMAGADLFALSSEWEGFGNVIVEAMACGAPVVATDCPHGPGEIITHGINGLLVPVARPAALATALTRALGDPELRRALAAAGRIRANDFHAETIAGHYGDLFLRLAAGQAPQPAPPLIA